MHFGYLVYNTVAHWIIVIIMFTRPILTPIEYKERNIQGETIKDIIPFPLNENQFSVFVADHLLVGQLCTNPKSDRSLLSYLKVTQCSMSEIKYAPLYNSCSLPIQVMTARTIAGLPQITGMYPGWWKQSFRLRLRSLVWFQVRVTSCHLTSSKSAWKSTPKCTWMCWRVWWSPGAIGWLVADPGCGSRTWCQPTSPKRPRLGIRRSATTLYPSLTGPPSSPNLNPPDYFVWSYVKNITNMTSRCHPPSIRQAPAGAYEKGMLPVPDPYRSCDWGWRRLHWIDISSTDYIIKLPELIFFNKSFKIKL